VVGLVDHGGPASFRAEGGSLHGGPAGHDGLVGFAESPTF
jgi:hypothetical protein